MAARSHTVKLPAELTEALALARVRLGLTHAPQIAEEALGSVERDLDERLPPELLGVFVALGRDLGKIVKLTDQAQRAGLDERYLAFDSGDDGFWCIRATTSRGAQLVGRWSPGEDQAPLEECSLARYVRRAHGLFAEPTDAERAEVLAEMKSFRVKVIRRPSAVSRRVLHPKFGEGTVLRETRDGHHKLEIQFATGVRTVLAQFVTDAVQRVA